jgi:class 3 adenylate cyclase/predicted ATPase
MDFYEILDQVIDLLKQRGRASYRALKRQFALDDAYLEDLKVEIIKVQQLAVDQDGEMLLWTGEAERQPVPTSTQPALQEVTPAIPPTQAAPPPEAERRQLTVMFCDLVDSTRLSSQFDPEEYRDVVRAYQSACTEVIQRYDGYIAQYLGDGLLVYFGYPQAHEDDAQRAVHTGLGIIEAVEALNTSLEPAKGIILAVRLGIHTGLVVVGDMGGGGRQEQLALGEVPNVAARMQGLAESNTIIISPDTYRLIQGYFTCEALGEQTLRGIPEPVAVYGVLGESGATSRLDVAQSRGLTPLIGRESEVTLLQERWAQAKAGHGHVVLLTGESGIGKSRLVQMLKDHVANEPHVRWECRSAEYYQNTALYPLTDLFQRILQWQHDETPDEKLSKLEQALRQYRMPLEESVPLFAPLLALPVPENRYYSLTLSPQRQRQKTLETIIAILLEQAEQHPVLFIIEDLHWTDPTTLELIGLLLDQTPTASLLVLLTCRPHFQPAWHHRSYLTEITVNRLSHAQVEQIVNRMTDGKILPKEVLAQIVEKTDGVPLFVEEMTKAILESGQLKVLDGHYELIGSLSTFATPATLQDSLMARLDRLVTAKGVAQLGATIGRQFPYELLQAVSQVDASTLQRELGRLVEAEIVYQRGLPPQATYVFKHALIQDAGYQSLLKSTRQGYHQRIAQVLEAQFSETAEAEPELLAHHYTEAGLAEQAINYWQRAGQRAIQRSAHLEAIGHLNKGLAMLATLPDSPEHLQQELGLQTTLGPALMVVKGYAAPEVQQVYGRAWELCRHVEQTPQLFQVLWGLAYFYTLRSQCRTAREVGEQLLSLAQRAQDPVLLQQAHNALAGALLHLGELAAAQAHLQQGLALYNPQQHRVMVLRLGNDLGVFFLAYMVRSLWLLGYPDQALQQSQKALTMAQELAHPFSLTYALTFAAFGHQFRREAQATHMRAEAACALAGEQGIGFFLAVGTVLRGWALAEQGQSDAGIVQMREGMAVCRTTGAEADRPYFLALAAEAYGREGRYDEGLAMLEEALALVDQSEERYWEAEIHRLKGESLLARSAEHQVEAEACVHTALNVARRQQAKSLELRAATSLARLWQQQGKPQEAYDLLAPVYHWFTEGFDTADLKDAKALLDALGEQRHDI